MEMFGISNMDANEEKLVREKNDISDKVISVVLISYRENKAKVISL